MVNTKSIGELAEAKMLAALVASGEHVLIPFGDNLRYDLGIEKDGKLYRVQVKHGVLKGGVIEFNTGSYDYSKQLQTYQGEAEFFGVYCSELDACYLVPVSVAGETKTRLRVEPTKNNQLRRVRFARDFEVGR